MSWRRSPMRGHCLRCPLTCAACPNRASSGHPSRPKLLDRLLMEPLRLATIEAFAYRVPIAKPIKVSFGTFRDRPFVLVRAVDIDGVEGWGEAWCNWPAVGAEHRARLVADLGERLIGRTLASPEEAFRQLSAELEVLVLQTGEAGPIAQAIAGIDIALSDLAARKAGLPLCRWLGGAPTESVPVYATGINPDGPEIFAAERRSEGHRAFKLKIGFGADTDLRNLRALRDALGEAAVLMTDANQALTREAAIAISRTSSTRPCPTREARPGAAAS